MVVLAFKVTGEREVARDLMNMADRIGDARPAFALIAEQMREATDEHFDSAQSTWAPLKPSTIRAKLARGQDPRILHATLTLRRSLAEHGLGHLEVITDHGMLFGTLVPYAGFHQSGTTRMPQRKVLDFPEVAMRSFTKTVQRYIVEGDIALFGGNRTPVDLK